MIINVALTGCVHAQADNPNLPITPEEVAADVRQCYDAGATMFHVHARNGHGNPCWGAGNYQPFVDAVRHGAPGAVVVASCSGRHFKTFMERSGTIHTGPDMASLTMGSFNTMHGANVNEPSMIEALAKEMQEHGVVPELECFDIGHVAYIHRLISTRALEPPYYVNLFLGNLGSIPATQEFLGMMIDMLPDDSRWAGAGLGRFQFITTKWAISLGGDVRVGLEDSLWMDEAKTDLASNVRMVERAVEVGRILDREVEDAREVLFG